MIDFLLRHLWAECQLLIVGVLVWLYADASDEERREKFHRKGDLFFGLGLILLGPMSVTAILLAAVHDYGEGVRRMRCRIIVSKWSKKAQEQQQTYEMTDWAWHKDKKYQEIKYICMRETISILSDQELNYLAKTGSSAYTLEEELVDAVASEILHREIAKT